MMRGLSGVLLALAATTLLESPASAHHSQSMFDTTREMLFEGTVVRFDWVNPHMYLIVETRGPDGKPLRVEGEGLATTQARADGLKREALRPGMRVVMRANPNREPARASRSAFSTSRPRTARFIPSMRRAPAIAR